MTRHSSETCLRCAFWKLNPETSDPADAGFAFGSCRRDPPRIVESVVRAVMPLPQYGNQVDPDIDPIALSTASLWPATHSSDWCGAFYNEPGVPC